MARDHSTTSFTRLRHLLLSSLWILTAFAQTPAASPQKSAADYYVHHLPGAPEPLLNMHAGHIEVTPEHHGNLFFWHFAARHIGRKERTVIWLNGGPGCSSLDGAMAEVGPYRAVDKDTLQLRNGSWDEYANLLFVDQPVGTGFSYVDTDSYLHDLDQMASNMMTFLEKYFTVFPDQVTQELYFAGESYAGQYIPYIAKAILDRNKKIGSNDNAHKWNLQGLLIGNGWIAPNEQYQAYLPYAYKEGMIQSGTPESEKVEKQHLQCLDSLSAQPKEMINNRVCENVLTELLRVTHDMPKMKGKCYNMYDIRLTDEYSSCGMNWPEDLKSMNPYLTRKDVAQALNLNADKMTGWTECNNQVGAYFNAANSAPAVDLLPGLLSEIPVLLFSGDRDLICNHLGTEAFINKLSFNGGKGLETSPGVTAPKLDWTFDGQAAGTYQSARNLTYVVFYNSSHMVPVDYPFRSRDMLDRFMGVDYTIAGGSPPKDSAIDGLQSAKNNSTTAAAEKAKVDQARWDAYYRSGEVALVVVLAAAALWTWFVLRSRRAAGYKGLFGDENGSAAGMGFLRPSSGVGRPKDVEAADFDEAELDELTAPSHGRRYEDEAERFHVGEESSDDEGRGVNGHK
ncbi:carboxypeptidase B-like-like protein [Myriangium duriaei CBS 260.36]|uniref:Pheromone-processing carboxypeptidase KEX1 n=1 Tax=Myriangium duriaei CBS 260.36 TaxID=1168546 RepID=A0A9P4IVS4_9PEZI|nr:carboxypeptidase B-like-like protein [Myriangium duriaei CBS 260.36]